MLRLNIAAAPQHEPMVRSAAYDFTVIKPNFYNLFFRSSPSFFDQSSYNALSVMRVYMNPSRRIFFGQLFHCQGSTIQQWDLRISGKTLKAVHCNCANLEPALIFQFIDDLANVTKDDLCSRHCLDSQQEIKYNVGLELVVNLHQTGHVTHGKSERVSLSTNCNVNVHCAPK